jgi:LEA14-like dessication related protein
VRARAARALCIAALPLLVAVLVGCAAFGPRIDAPRVSVVDVRLDRIQGPDVYFVAGVELANPNPRPIEVAAIDATLSIEDQTVATARLMAPVEIPAGGTSSAEIAARTGMDALLRAVANAMRRAGGGPPGTAPTLRYEIAGSARLAGGLQVPFRRSSELGTRPSR